MHIFYLNLFPQIFFKHRHQKY
uniref:Uncharacterized protein n=1 Tax=Chlorante-Aster yellows phytoplasma TaxID=54389 RepID=O05279_CHAYP|nr:unknown [Chlorante-Aster yellows phytoplasma]